MPQLHEIQNRVINIVSRISGIPPEEMCAESTFEQLELDSLSRIELLVDLEREFEIDAPDDQDDEEILNKIQSIDDAARLVQKNLAELDAA